MQQELKEKTLIYKKSELTPPKLKLQSILSAALKANKPGGRKEAVTHGGDNIRVINSHTAHAGMLFGSLISFEPGRDLALITPDDDSENWEIETTPVAKSDEGRQRELFEGLLYFGIKENHVLLLQSAAVKAREFENHLAWLLGSHSKVAEEFGIVLSDEPTLKAKEAIEKSEIKSLKFGTPVGTRVEVPAEPDETGAKKKTKKEEKQFRWLPDGKGIELLKTYFGTSWNRQLNLKESSDLSNLRVALEISYVRTNTVESQEVLKNIARATRNAESEDVSIKLKDGSVLSGDDVKLRKKVTVRTIGGNVDKTDLYRQMEAYLKEQIASGVLL